MSDSDVLALLRQAVFRIIVFPCRHGSLLSSITYSSTRQKLVARPKKERELYIGEPIVHHSLGSSPPEEITAEGCSVWPVSFLVSESSSVKTRTVGSKPRSLMDNSQARLPTSNVNEDVGGLKHIVDWGDCDSIAIKDPNTRFCSEDQDSDTEQHKRASGHEQPGVVRTLGHNGRYRACSGRFRPLLFLDGFTSPKPSRSRQFFEVDAPTPPVASVMSGLTLAKLNV